MISSRMFRIHLVIGCFNVLCFGQDIPQDCFSPLGMEDEGIRDEDIRATSSLPSAFANYGRLNHIDGFGGWCPDQWPYENDTGPIYKEFIQVHFSSPFRIKGIITQPRSGGVERIRKFLVAYRQDQENNKNIGWYFEGSHSQRPKVFEGNSLSELKPPVVTDLIRIYPMISPRRQVCLRFELFGCQLESAIVTYEILQGNSLDGRYNFTDSNYDGLTKGRRLVSGLGMLTDGRLANEDLTVNNGLGWIGWNMKETPKPFIIFDFLNKRIFNSATFHCNVKDQIHIKLFSRVEIRFSKTMQNGSSPDLMQEPKEISVPSSSSINHNVTIDLCRRVGKSVRFNFTYRGQWILISEVIFNSEPLEGRSPPAVYCVPSSTHPRYTSSTSEYNASTISSTTSTETTVAPSAEGPDWVMLISSLTVLFVILVILGIAWSFRRKRRQKKDERPRVVESDQSEESLTLVPVGATPQLELSESNNDRNQDTEESPRDEYEEIELSPPVMMVPSDSAQTPVYAQASSACSHTYAQPYTPVEKNNGKEHEYVNQIKTSDYANTYMPLTNLKRTAENSRAYASLLPSKEEKDDNL